jgi:8-oxo-dGTP diphosphatase
MMLRQFAVFGRADRSFASEIELKAGLQSGSDKQLLDWFLKRFISLCYIALVDYQGIKLKPTAYFESAEWFPINQAEKLAMDHAEILHSAREFLYKEIPHSPVIPNLLPATFTLPEFQALMEAIMNRNIDRPNFRRKIISSGILEKVGVDNSGKRRPADKYRFVQGKDTAVINEFKYGF